MVVDAPAKQNASAMHTSTSSRSNSGGKGLNGASRLAVSIHAIGKTCRGRSVANLAGIPSVLRRFGSLDAGMAVSAIDHDNKNRDDSTVL
jgi:hypothetical protein